VNSASWWASKLGSQQKAPSLPPVSPPPPPRLPPAYQPTPQTAPSLQVTSDNLAEATTLWQGGEASRTETQRCPQCGSDHYFSRSNSGATVTTSGMAAPAPRCYDCGYTAGRPMQGLPPA
jgi:hypothetical protein